MTLVYVALMKDSQATSVMGVFTSPTDAHEAVKKHPRAWFEPCRLNGFTDYGSSLVKIREQVNAKASAWRPVGLVQVDRNCVSNAQGESERKSSTEVRPASAPKILK